MKTFRIVFGILMVIPLTLLTDKFFIHPALYDEDSLQTILYHAVGVPIMILNLWAWIYPQIIEVYFLGKKKDDNS